MFVDWHGVEGSSTEKMSDIYIVTKGGCSGGVGKIPVSFHKYVAAGETSSVYDMPAILDDPPSQGEYVSCSNGPFRAWTGADMRRDGRLIAMIRAGAPASACLYVSSTSYGLPNERQHEAVAFVDAGGTRLADISECQGGCSPT